MTSKETRQYQMLARVHEFGKKRSNLFPDASEGGQAFAAVANVVAELTAYDDSKSKSSEDGKLARTKARQALVEGLRPISRTARVIAKKTAGFPDRFRMPRSKASDQALLAAGRRFADSAEPVKDRFVAHDLSDTFITEVRELITQFEDALRERAGGKEQQVVSQKGLAAALAAGLDTVRSLDAIVRNKLKNDRDSLAAWDHDRRIDVPRRVRRKASSGGEEPSASPVVAPVVGLISAPVAPTTATAPTVTTGAAAPTEAGPAGKAA